MIGPCQGRHGKYLKNDSRKFHVGVLVSTWDLRHFVMPCISLCISESVISEYCPNAQRCIDPFHVVSWAMEALEKVRRRTLAATSSKVGPSEKRKPGRPRKGEKVESAAKKAKAVKFTKFALLKNPENLSSVQKEQVEFLSKANPQLYRAYLLIIIFMQWMLLDMVHIVILKIRDCQVFCVNFLEPETG